ncbi:hypothetical protein [Brevundimonas sp. BH3]|uniref:hypothetical protein n=1 Tax=Brevundimonas sp. BH3 TaxID=3133089 RepID=UPI003877F914
MANSLELKLSAYRNYEQGLRDPPARVIFAICELYKIEAVWLLGGIGPIRTS